MSHPPVAQIQLKKQIFSKIFLGFILIGLLVLGLLKLKEMLYQPVLEIEYHPFGLEIEDQLSAGTDAELPTGDIDDLQIEDQKRYKKALLLYKTEEPEAAFQIIEQIIPLYQNNTSLLVLYAQSALASEQEPEILLDIRRKIHHYLTQDQHPAISLQKALIDEVIENPEDARKTLHNILKESPQFSQAHYELARLELQGEEYNLARRSLQHSISLDLRTREPSYVMLSQLYHDQGMLDSLELLLKLTTQNYPYNPDFNLYLAYLKEYQSDLEEAALIYKRMMQIHPEDTRFDEAMKTIGYKEAPLNQNDQQSPQFQTALNSIKNLHQNDPNNSGLAYAYYLLLKLSRNSEWVDEAKEIHSKYQTLFPQDSRWNPKAQNPTLNQQVVQKDEPQDSLLALAQSGIQISKDQTHARRNWDVVGHYLVDWNSSVSAIQSQYPESKFSRIQQFQDTVQYREEYEDPMAQYQYNLFYHQDQLKRILVHFEEQEKNSDILGEILHKLVGVSGKPMKIRQNYCPGFKKFQAYHWSSKENFEILIQFNSRSSQAKLLRLNPKDVTPPFEICQALPYLLDRAPQKDTEQ